MTNKQKRQERFIQKIRFKSRIKKMNYFSSKYINNRLQGMLYHTRKLCSCHMCGNPRKYFSELTIKEKSNVEFLNSLNNYNDDK